MIVHKNLSRYYTVLFLLLLLSSCNNPPPAVESEIVKSPEEIDIRISRNLKSMLAFAIENTGKINDSQRIYLPGHVYSFYKEAEFKNAWSSKEKWQPLADSLFQLISHAESYGLFPQDYHARELNRLRTILTDSLARMDAVLWSHADLLMTDGLMRIFSHIKKGRLQHDSISLSGDSTGSDDFFVKHINEALKSGSISKVISTLEPLHPGYKELKKGIQFFLDSMDRKKYTYVVYPNRDSIALVKNVQKRLLEGAYISAMDKLPDSLQFSGAIKKFQKSKKLKADGKLGAATVRNLNMSDEEKFKQIAITLDRYKQLPVKLPAKFIWVNLPGYYLRLWENDSVKLESKVIVGKPGTRTPTLNSEITDMITYPQWTIPASIIKKEILPGLKRNPGYLSRRGYSLVDNKGGIIDPYNINWEKYKTGIPYKVRQGSGDDNALGIMKFNFNNPYSVYLHDTNQRYLFKNASRALSHGCVRVQEWEKLAFYIATNDSLSAGPGDSLKYTIDSIKTWLANKERKRMVVKEKIPLYIRYFTCEGKDGKIIFYDDIYGEDKKLRERYFANN